MLDRCVLTVLSYGAETGSLTKTQTMQIQKIQGAMERRIMEIRMKDKVGNGGIIAIT